MEYTLVKGTPGGSGLVDKVNEKIRQGWEPLNGFGANEYSTFQPMVWRGKMASELGVTGKRVVRHALLRNASTDELELLVNEHIKAGWRPLGGVCFGNGEFCQGMVFEE